MEAQPFEEVSMSSRLRSSSIPLVVVPIVFLLVAVLMAGQRGPSNAAAVPAGEAVGKVTFTGLTGGVTLGTTIRSFSYSGSTPSGGKYVPGSFQLNLDTGGRTPLLLRAVTTGIHLPTTTVVLYRPGTTTRTEQWTLSDVMVSSHQNSQFGPPSKAPRLVLALTFRKITWATYAADGTTVVESYCWDTVTITNC